MKNFRQVFLVLLIFLIAKAAVQRGDCSNEDRQNDVFLLSTALDDVADGHTHPNITLRDPDIWINDKCFPFNSCENRCGSLPLATLDRGNDSLLNFVCFCDSDCSRYNDCCEDYEPTCQKMRNKQLGVFSTRKEGIEPIMKCENINKNLILGSFWMVSSCPLKSDMNLIKKCKQVKREDTLSRLPVVDDDGVSYRNIYCALCHQQTKFSFWKVGASCRKSAPKAILIDSTALAVYLRDFCEFQFYLPLRSMPRPCFPTLISTCAKEIASSQNNSPHSMIIGREDESSNALNIFENPGCAQCNGINSTSMVCPVLKNPKKQIQIEYFMQSADNFLTRKSVGNHTTSTQRTPYSVLMNFNFDSQSSVKYGSDSGDIIPDYSTCDPDMVYDPALAECRKVYCGDGYVLVNNTCSKETEDTEEPIELPLAHNITILVEKIVITLTITLKDISRQLNFLNQDDLPEVIVQIKEYFDTYVTILPDNCMVSMVEIDISSEMTEGTLNNTLSLDANGTLEFTGVATIELKFILNNVTLFIDEFAEWFENLRNSKHSCLLPSNDNIQIDILVCNISRSKDGRSSDSNPLALVGSLCSLLNGDLVQYSYPEITLLTTGPNSSVVLYVNTTETFYESGAYFLLSGPENDNMTTTALVCEPRPLLDSACLRIRLNQSEYETFPNKSIKYAGEIYELDEYSLVNEDNCEACVEVCTDLSDTWIEDLDAITFFEYDYFQTILTYMFSLCSLFGLFITFAIYWMLPQLRTLPGLNTMSLTVSMFLSQLVFVVGIDLTEDYEVCATVASVLHYLYLTGFFWMNVMALDVHSTFGTKNIVKKMKRSRKQLYFWYSVYGWGFPLFIVIPCVVMNFCDCTSFVIGYGIASCWINNSYSLLYFFALPLAVVLLVNSVLFLHTIYSIKTAKEGTKLGRKKTKNQLRIYIKMSTVMGFAWIFGFVAGFTSISALWYPFIILNSLQGVFICCAFVCNKRVFKMFKKRYGCLTCNCFSTKSWKREKYSMRSVGSQSIQTDPARIRGFRHIEQS